MAVKKNCSQHWREELLARNCRSKDAYPGDEWEVKRLCLVLDKFAEEEEHYSADFQRADSSLFIRMQ